MTTPLVHYLSSGRALPPCSDRGAVSPAFWDVTCPDCLISLPFALAQFRHAYLQLFQALVSELRPRRRRSHQHTR